MRQTLLFPDPSPLVERLGVEFFRRLPEGPGIYLMKGAADVLLYVGKAKNLRKRLGSYRVANPDRMPRRHLRLLRAVECIEIQECADERAALAREAQLLRTLRPRFNRAGTWPSTPKYIAWKWTSDQLHLTVTTTPEADWRAHGPVGAGAFHLRAALVRVLWLAVPGENGYSQMPAGWFRGHCGETVRLEFQALTDVSAWMEKLAAGNAEGFSEWALGLTAPDLSPFDKSVLTGDLEFLADTFGNRPPPAPGPIPLSA